eukprot:superscaffoldBa00009388_g24060
MHVHSVVQTPSDCLVCSRMWTKDLPFLLFYLDDILVTSASKAEHMSHLRTFFKRLSQRGLIVNPAKCQLRLSTIDFLRHHITKDRAVPLPSKLMRPCYEALICRAPKHTVDWSVESDKAFMDAKTDLANATMLAHPSPNAPIAITTDASDYAQRQLSNISQFTTDIQHVAGKNNLITDCLSRAISGDVHFGLDYASMAADQATDWDVQAFRTAVTGLQLEDVTFDGSGSTLLSDVFTGWPWPVVPVGWRRRFLRLSTASLTQAGNPLKDWWQLGSSSTVKKEVRDWAATCMECQDIKDHSMTRSCPIVFNVIYRGSPGVGLTDSHGSCWVSELPPRRTSSTHLLNWFMANHCSLMSPQACKQPSMFSSATMPTGDSCNLLTTACSTTWRPETSSMWWLSAASQSMFQCTASNRLSWTWINLLDWPSPHCGGALRPPHYSHAAAGLPKPLGAIHSPPR